MKRLVIAFSGPSNSGKTTLICKIAKIFIASGLRIAIVKHDPGDKARFDVEGKDSAKFSELGAETVVMSPARTSYFSQRCMQIDEVVRMLGEFDILLVEGLKTLPLPRISLFRDRIDPAYLPFSDAIASNLSGEQMDKFCCVNFDIDDAAGISEWILKNAKKNVKE